jgi:hypothetical protein
MGRKGKNVRKPKRATPFSNTNSKSPNTHTGESLSVQALVQDRNAPFNKGSARPAGESNKNRNKGN